MERNGTKFLGKILGKLLKNFGILEIKENLRVIDSQVFVYGIEDKKNADRLVSV